MTENVYTIYVGLGTGNLNIHFSVAVGQNGCGTVGII